MLAVLRHPNGNDTFTHCLEEVLRHDPDNFNALTQLALLRFFDYEDLKCIRLLRKALEVRNSFVPALVAMGELERFTGRSDISKKYYARALKLDEYQIFALKGLVKACINTDSTEEAWKYL